MAPWPTPWDDDRIEELKRLWAEGYSAREIAEQLGGFTRSAVLGKIDRLGLLRRREPRPQKPRVLRSGWRQRPVFIAPPPPPPPPPPQPSPRSRPRRLQLMQLAERHCRWPVGDPRRRGFYFCAADCEAGRVYCSFHMRKAFAKTRG